MSSVSWVNPIRFFLVVQAFVCFYCFPWTKDRCLVVNEVNKRISTGFLIWYEEVATNFEIEELLLAIHAQIGHPSMSLWTCSWDAVILHVGFSGGVIQSHTESYLFQFTPLQPARLWYAHKHGFVPDEDFDFLWNNCSTRQPSFVSQGFWRRQGGEWMSRLQGAPQVPQLNKLDIMDPWRGWRE